MKELAKIGQRLQLKINDIINNLYYKKQSIFVKNTTNTNINPYICITVTGYDTPNACPTISPVSSISSPSIGITTSTILQNDLGKVLKIGSISIPGFDTSSANLYDAVYSDNVGNLTLSPTPIMIGFVLIQNANGTIFINPASFSANSLGISINNFNNALSNVDDTIQKIADRIDDYSWVGNWISNNSYRVGNIVRINSILYRCIISNSDPSFILNNWEIIKSSYNVTITNLDLINKVYTWNHNLNIVFSSIQIYDNNMNIILPSNVNVVDLNNVAIDFSGFTPIIGNYTIRGIV